MSRTEKQCITIKSALRDEKVLTLHQLASLCGCSVRTVQRRIQEWAMYRSYNQNGRYLTSDDVACFDKNGLWKYGEVFFSRFGNLRNTIICLVQNSQSGLTGNELGILLGLSPRSFLSHFRDDPSLYREEIDGLYVYFSGDSEDRNEQRSCRMAENAYLCGQEKLPPPQSIIALLVELVNNPDRHPKHLMERLAAKGCSLSQEEIERIFHHYKIGKKNSIC